jgi:glycosyltransferase involved in cell wall biosynthesis
MRLALLTSKYHPTTCGVGDYAMRLGAELRRGGAEVTLIARRPAHPHPEALELEPIAVRGSGPCSSAWRVLRALRRLGPDALVVQYVPHMLGATRFGSPAVPLLCRALRSDGIRVVAIAHELYLPRSTRPDLAVASALGRMQLTALAASVDRLVVTTEPRFDEVRRALGPELARRLALVPVGANALPRPSQPVPGRADIGLFSTLGIGKRIEVALEAFESLAQSNPGARLVLLGDLGSEQGARFRALAERIRASRYSGRIDWRGKLPLAEISDAISRLDVFVFPSDVGATTRSGTLPVALGSGIPVVATRGPDSGAVFRDGENVLFARDLSPESLSEAISLLLRNAILRERIGRGGRDLYELALSWPVIARRILELVGGPAI